MLTPISIRRVEDLWKFQPYHLTISFLVLKLVVFLEVVITTSY